MNHYKTLGISANATSAAIRSAYLKKVKEYHPDVSHLADKKFREEKFKQVQNAYSILRDEEKRKEYDLTLHIPQSHTANMGRRTTNNSTVETSGDPFFYSSFYEQAERVKKQRQAMYSAYERNRASYKDQTPYHSSYHDFNSHPSDLVSIMRTMPYFFLPFFLFSAMLFLARASQNRKNEQSGYSNRLPIFHDTFGRAYIIDDHGRRIRTPNLDLTKEPPRS